MPKVSIVVPIYNTEPYLPTLLESLVRQTWRDLEVILVDDGSPDRCGAICDDYAARDPRVSVIHKANGGVSAARNDGLEAATGEWILFCDADDWMEPDAVEQLLRAALETRADIALGDANLVYGTRVIPNPLYRQGFVADGTAAIDRLIAAIFSRNYCADPPAAGPGNGGYGGPWNKLVKRQLLIDHHIRFDVRLRGHFDDMLFLAHAYACARRIVYIDKPVYNYRQLDNSIAHTTAFKKDILQINDKIFTAWEEFLEQHGADGRFQKPYYANVIRRFKATLGTYFFHPNHPGSLAEQFRELTDLLKREPYAAAIREADLDRLHNHYDQLVCLAARLGSALGLLAVYRISVMMKDIRKKRNTKGGG